MSQRERERFEHYTSAGTLYFYGGPLSSFRKRVIMLPPRFMEYETVMHQESFTYTCREDFFQSAKAITRITHDYVLGDMIDTWKVKTRGRSIHMRPDWEVVKYDVMLTCIRHELETDLDLRRLVLATGDRLIAEDSPTDDIWGIRDVRGGLTGQNLLGNAWMEARGELRGA